MNLSVFTFLRILYVSEINCQNICKEAGTEFCMEVPNTKSSQYSLYWCVKQKMIVKIDSGM